MPYPSTTVYPSTSLYPAVSGSGVPVPFRPGATTLPGATLYPGVGTPILDGAATLYVQAAWGADLTAASTGWTWTDITGDVLQAGNAGIALTHGRSDEASTSQPAHCSLTLDNRSGAYSLGVQSSNYPYVRRNTPIRVGVDVGEGFQTLFLGYADGWTPEWDVSGRYAVVRLSASGVLRRLLQGSAAVSSVLRRTLAARTDMVAYWPCEDGTNATEISSGLTGGSPMSIYGKPTLASDSTFYGSDPLPVLNNADLLGVVPDYTATGYAQVRFLTRFSAALTASSTLCRVFTTGTAMVWDIVVDTGGGTLVYVYDRSWTQVFAASWGLNNYNDGNPCQVDLALTQSGADISYQIATLNQGFRFGLRGTGTVAGYTFGTVKRVEMGPNINISSASVGHIQVRNTVTSVFSEYNEINAYNGESPTTRLARLADENGLQYATRDGTADTEVHAMGPQRSAGLVDLLRQCETVGQGQLVDGVGDGLTYVTARKTENADAALTLDAASGELADDVGAVDDDRLNRNKAVVTRTGGVSYTYEDDTGPLGTATIGIYDTSLSINADNDVAPQDYAAWLVHRGTIEGYRYPTVHLALHHDPSLAPAWTAVRPGDRLDLTSISTVRTQHPTGTVSLVVEGFTQHLTQHTWDVVINASPFEPWRIATAAATTGDTSEYVLRPESDGSTLAASASAGATSLSVATPSGPLWTTTADDFPLYIEVSGVKVTVTSISGTSSPQTFTVTGATVTSALSSGATVKLWHPPVPGL